MSLLLKNLRVPRLHCTDSCGKGQVRGTSKCLSVMLNSVGHFPKIAWKSSPVVSLGEMSPTLFGFLLNTKSLRRGRCLQGICVTWGHRTEAGGGTGTRSFHLGLPGICIQTKVANCLCLPGTEGCPRTRDIQC